MGKHHTEDYKLSAVKHALRTDNQVAESNNTIQYTVPYYPRSNPIEQYFSQVKHYIKKESPILFADIKKIVEKSIDRVSKDNYNNYFLHAFRSETLLKTRRVKRILKTYKN